MLALCSFTSGLHAHGPQLSQLAPRQTPELPVSHEAVLPQMQLMESCPCPTGLLLVTRLGEPWTYALWPPQTFKGKFTSVNITYISLLDANCSENVSWTCLDPTLHSREMWWNKVLENHSSWIARIFVEKSHRDPHLQSLLQGAGLQESNCSGTGTGHPQWALNFTYKPEKPRLWQLYLCSF